MFKARNIRRPSFLASPTFQPSMQQKCRNQGPLRGRVEPLLALVCPHACSNKPLRPFRSVVERSRARSGLASALCLLLPAKLANWKVPCVSAITCFCCFRQTAQAKKADSQGSKRTETENVVDTLKLLDYNKLAACLSSVPFAWFVHYSPTVERRVVKSQLSSGLMGSPPSLLTHAYYHTHLAGDLLMARGLWSVSEMTNEIFLRWSTLHETISIGALLRNTLDTCCHNKPLKCLNCMYFVFLETTWPSQIRL